MDFLTYQHRYICRFLSLYNICIENRRYSAQVYKDLLGNARTSLI